MRNVVDQNERKETERRLDAWVEHLYHRNLMIEIRTYKPMAQLHNGNDF